MLSIAKLSPGQEAYYEASVAQGLDDYYAGRGESPGVWHGAGASALGLVGVVEDGDLGRLMRGLDPSTERQLRASVSVRRIRVEQLDAATGERRLVERELRPVAGFDLVFSAPKSVSLLHALGDERVRFETSQAHQAAWQAALSYLEETACVTRRGRNGVVREWGSGLVASAFAHRTSRALDPHLHTHVIVANMAQSPDGTWRALDGDLLLPYAPPRCRVAVPGAASLVSRVGSLLPRLHRPAALDATRRLAHAAGHGRRHRVTPRPPGQHTHDHRTSDSGH